MKGSDATGLDHGLSAGLDGNGVRYVQSPTEIVMAYEMIHESRVIHPGNPPKAPRGGGQGQGVPEPG